MSVHDDVRRHILDEVGWSKDPEDLTGAVDLIEQHVLDSLAVVELSVLLEQWYGVEVSPSEMVYDNFHSIDAIAAYVARKRRPVR
jgi:acyl carrier protein